MLNAQVSVQLQATPYERSDQRQGYRNGYKPRQLTTRVGALTLLVPQVRDRQFSTSCSRATSALMKAAHGQEVRYPSTFHAWTFYVHAPGGFMVEVLS